MPRKGYKQTAKHRENLSKAKIGKKRPDISERMKGKTGEKHPKYGKKCPGLSERRKGKGNPMFGRVGEKNPMFGRTGEKCPLFGRKCPDISERMKGENNPNYGKGLFGENHPNYRGGTSKEPYCPEFTEDHKEYIKHRDGYKCMYPGCDKPITKNNSLCVHHIDYDKKNCIPENEIILCKSHNISANYNRDFHQDMYKTIIKQYYN